MGKVIDHYAIKNILGKGFDGCVYYDINTITQKIVVIKKIKWEILNKKL